jgi:hypothetical protein
MAAVPEKYYAWFRCEAETLPDDVKRRVLRALEFRDPRAVFDALHKLGEAGQLPESWRAPLGDLYQTVH